MGATKLTQYPNHLVRIAIIADALGHPARLTIIQLLQEKPYLRPADFEKILCLSKGATVSHLNKLRRAHIIDYIYFFHEYKVHLNKQKMEELSHFL